MADAVKIDGGSGILYEPRSLWDVINYTPSNTAATSARMRRNEFFNGGQYPITITRLAMCPVGYALYNQNPADPGPTNPQYFESSMQILNRMQLRVTAPFRRYFSRNMTGMNSLRPVLTQPTTPINSSLPSSSLYGISRLDFDRPVILPKQGQMQFEMSAYPMPQAGLGGLYAAGDYISASMAYHEAGGSMNGSMRFRPPAMLGTVSNDAFDFGGVIPTKVLVNKGVGYPTATNGWPAAGKFSTQLFDRENPSRAGSAAMGGISVLIDQRIWDDNAIPSFPGYVAGVRGAPVSTQVGCRMKTSSGGTGEWYWKPGAPMALVLDTITPALVYAFDAPFTIAPGQTLEVELGYPPVGAAEITNVHNYTFGVSLNGFAIIEG